MAQGVFTREGAEQDILRSLAEQNGRLPPWMAGFFLHKYQL